ncbi:hypothetical protein EZS27_002161 [termite gut metagenome]|uniref:Uncharacterized protein n=1 Tax=termite gut metagenome TaxID=433724 RepID=A0A5J4SWH7_9ZZZZ
MIKTNIAREYPDHIKKYDCKDKSIYIADYTKQTQTKGRKGKGVRISIEPPTGIKCFSLLNDCGLRIGNIVFNNKSFISLSGTLSQCECVVFPDVAGDNSWIFFAELKYHDGKYNKENLKKAICQLYKTRTYYFQKGIFGINNTCYLVASLPTQPVPFANFSLTQEKIQEIKRKHNVVLRLTNKAEIVDTKMITI